MWEYNHETPGFFVQNSGSMLQLLTRQIGSTRLRRANGSTGLWVALLLGLQCSLAVGAPAPDAQRSSPAVGVAWPSYGATPGGTHFSRASQIDPANVSELDIAWIHRSGDVREASGRGEVQVAQSSHQVTPIVVDERVYYCSPFGRVFALDARTGKEQWSFDPGVDLNAEPWLLHCRGVSSWQSGEQGYCEHRIIYGTADARIIALDAATGRPCTDFGILGEIDTSQGMSEHHPREYGITSPPAILGDTIITGSMVLDNQRKDVPGGVVRAYDARSGELLWGWNPVPPGEEDKNPDGSWRHGTANVWSMIAVDETRDLVFLPTGNTSPDYFGGDRAGLDHYSSSLVALRGKTGEVVWHFQFVHHDIWDYDTPAQPTLVDLPLGDAVIPAVVQVTKMGRTFVLNRETGEPLWPVEERPVPQSGAVEGEYLSPTQPYPTHIPELLAQPFDIGRAWGLTAVDRASCESRLGELLHEGLFTPPSEQGTLYFPSSMGGNNWGSPAVDPDTGLMVVYTSRVPGFVRMIPRDECGPESEQQKGTPYCVERGVVMSPLGIPCSEPPWGTLDAIDLVRGHVLWSVPMGTSRHTAPFPFWWIDGLPGVAAPMITASGLVFSGITNDHVLRAFDLADGRELWSGKLPTAGNALPMTYQLAEDGKQFVVIAAGGHWSGGSPAGDYLIAFALPD